jgi:hypothetical protein
VVLACHCIFVEVLTKFGFVACGMVKLFDFVVRSLAVTIRFSARNMVVAIEFCPPSIFFIMETKTGLPFMNVCVKHNIPVRAHLIVLNVAMSKRKNYPC